MLERKLSYEQYRSPRIHEAFGLADNEPEVRDDMFYEEPKAKPETDALMAQYANMQDALLNIKPQTPEYDKHLQNMTDVMDQLLKIDPSLAVRGEEQRLHRIAKPIEGKFMEANGYDNEYEQQSDWQPSDWDEDMSEQSTNEPMTYEEYAAIRDEAEGRDISQYPQMAEMSAADKLLSYGRNPAEQTADDTEEDPEDAQAKHDLEEISGVYGWRLGSTKDGKLAVYRKGGLLGGGWTKTFPDYISAMEWAKKAEKVSRRSQ